MILTFNSINFKANNIFIVLLNKDDELYYTSFKVDEDNKMIEKDEYTVTNNIDTFSISSDEFKELVQEEKINEIINENISEIEKFHKINKLIELKKELSDTDYIVTKAQEFTILGEEVPIDLLNKIEERKNIRVQINELETEIE
ncbi:hypothetical protein [Methanobrevibacter filiformis]|uniref:Uncharacterized protein n=1 Tax=Methanobrevibacter filiformis TaxID=55758 RepID=A0A166FAY7_9EURY|nr:hypothetical protein [Methanobrevibacter filiformis]KZX17483.1 hypothetical protein MBFIL_01410 [Methanobrevibacter filiformis]